MVRPPQSAFKTLHQFCTSSRPRELALGEQSSLLLQSPPPTSRGELCTSITPFLPTCRLCLPKPTLTVNGSGFLLALSQCNNADLPTNLRQWATQLTTVVRRGCFLPSSSGMFGQCLTIHVSIPFLRRHIECTHLRLTRGCPHYFTLTILPGRRGMSFFLARFKETTSTSSISWNGQTHKNYFVVDKKKKKKKKKNNKFRVDCSAFSFVRNPEQLP